MTSSQKSLAHYQTIVWDWNGTLLDDVQHAVGIMAGILERAGLPPIDCDSYRELFCFPVRAYYDKLGFAEAGLSFEAVSEEFISQFNLKLDRCQLQPNAIDVVSRLKAMGKHQMVLSATNEAFLGQQLQRFGLGDSFHSLWGLADNHAHGKGERGQQMMAEHSLKPTQTLLIGDTDHDLEVGKQLGIDVILVGHGHQSHRRLQAHHHVVDRLRDLPGL